MFVFVFVCARTRVVGDASGILGTSVSPYV